MIEAIVVVGEAIVVVGAIGAGINGFVIQPLWFYIDMKQRRVL